MSDEVQRFSATSGRVLGIVALVLAAVVLVLIVLDSAGDPSYLAIAVVVLVGALCWAALLRPRVELDDSRLVLHNMLSTDTLPLVAVESVAVRQVLVVVAGGRRYTSPAVGRPRRQLQRDARRPGGGDAVATSRPEVASYGVVVEERIRAKVADALARQGIAGGSAEQQRAAGAVTRRPAVPEIVVLAASLVAVVALSLV